MGEKSFFADIHRELDAKMVPAGKFDLPLFYPGGSVAEHRHTLSAASVFDRSTMRCFQLAGKNIAGVLDGIFLRPVKDMMPGMVQENALLYENGSVAALFTLCRMQADDFMLLLWDNVPEKAVIHLQKLLPESAEIRELSGAMARLTVIGPAAEKILTDAGASQLPENGSWMMSAVQDEDGDEFKCIIVRNDRFGLTGFDICCNAAYALEFYGALYRISPLAPAGCGAWESLRTESSFPAFGSEIVENILPQECGLSKWVDFSGEFCGREALQKMEKFRTLVSVELDRLPALPGTAVMLQNSAVGSVTGGAFCPGAGFARGLCLIDAGVQTVPGMTLSCQVSGKDVAGKVSGVVEL